MWPSRWFGSGKIRCRDFSIFHFPLLFLDKSFPSQGWGNQKGQLWLQLVREGQVCENFFCPQGWSLVGSEEYHKLCRCSRTIGRIITPSPPRPGSASCPSYYHHLTITILLSPSHYHHLTTIISPLLSPQTRQCQRREVFVEQHRVVTEARKGDLVRVKRNIGGGGGHSLTVKDFKMTILHKRPIE